MREISVNKKKWCKLQKNIVFFLLLSVNTSLLANQFVLDLAYQVESGDYGGDSDTDVTIVPVLLKYYTDVWSFGAEISYVSVTGSATVIPGSNGQLFGQGSGSGSAATTTSKSVTRSGMGDSKLSLSRAFFPEQKDGVFYELTATVILATADEDKLLGKGENDYTIKLKTSSKLGLWSPALTVGYQLTGGTADTDFNNTLFFSVGSGYKLNKNSSLGVGYDFQQAVIDGVDDYAALTFNYSTQLNNDVELTLAMKMGLTDNSLDRGYSISASIPF